MTKFPRWIRSREQMFWYVFGKLFELACIIFIIVMAFLHLTGCSTYPPQQYAGIGYMIIEFDDSGNFDRVLSVNGKEAAAAEIHLENRDGAKLVISSEAIKAFRGQEARAEVEKTLAENGISPTAEIVDAILKVVAQ